MGPATTHEELQALAIDYLNNRVSVDVVGMRGSGRSAVLQTIAGTVAADDWQVVRVRGVRALAQRPLEALAIAGLLARGEERQAPTPVSAAVAGLLGRLDGERCLLVADDAHYLDDASVGAIATAHAEGSFVVLSATRSSPNPLRWPLPAAIHPGVRLDLPPLRYDQVYELIHRLVPGTVDPAVVAQVSAKSAGLPGLVTAIVEDASRHGLFAQRDGVWTAEHDLWTPELSRVVEVYLDDLSSSALDGLHMLSLLGPLDVARAREVVGADHLEQLDDHGLLAFVRAGDAVVVTVSPSLVAELFRHSRMTARGLRVANAVAAAVASGPDGDTTAVGDAETAVAVVPGPAQRSARRRQDDLTLSRVLRERHVAHVVACAEAWERNASPENAAAYLAAMMVRGADSAAVDRILGSFPPPDDPDVAARIAAWTAVHQAYVRHEVDDAMRTLTDAAGRPDARTAFLDGVADHLRLVFVRADPPGKVPEGASDEQRVNAAERLLVRGCTTDALALLDSLAPEDPVTAAQADLERAIALVCDGRIEPGLELARRRLAEGRTQLDTSLIHSHGYAIALGLLVGGYVGALRDHLWSLLTLGQVPIRQSYCHLGCLTMAARLAALDGHFASAHSLAQQADRVGLAAGAYPYMSASLATPPLDPADSEAQRSEAMQRWEDSRALAERGYGLASLFAGIISVEAAPAATPGRREHGAQLAEMASGMQGALLPALGQYAQALAAGDAESLLTVGDTLLEASIPGPGVRARVAAVQLLARDDATRRRALKVAEETRARAAAFGSDVLALVRPVLPDRHLSPREREVAELAAAGLSNAEIAERLVLSVRTVENHLRRAFQRLDVANRAQLKTTLAAAVHADEVAATADASHWH